MYCIIYYGYGNKRYLAFQDTDTETVYGYYLTDKETFVMNLENNKKNHPTLFKSEDMAMQFIKQFVSKRTGFPMSEFSYEYIDSYYIPKCDMDCWKCNKKNKSKCSHLKTPYQNYCGFIMAKFEDGFKPNKKRLDAPCEKCLTKGCPYNMNYK